ncbi:major facilitator superfamily-domain-containing protein [Apodospora peruviana]|uniref:Major facilitator superfamily-domain-containing protein n=1 Tax=Apodospora peruviana TaxID=516989 RepID=A0AAE0IPA4_9PEZI|nr:major facilitator superfamily-domain-containing protein [Apodospora peruviana]
MTVNVDQPPRLSQSPWGSTVWYFDTRTQVPLSSSSSSSSTSSLGKEKADLADAEAASPEVWVRGVGFWRCFTGLCIPILLSAFEGSVVSTALPTISQKLSLGPSSSWVATAFLLASIVCQPLYGQLADIWGRRYLMMIAVVLFGIGSAISAAADSGAALIIGRITQGMGSGGIDLFAELILCDIIPLKRRGHYVAIKAAVYALGTTVGPVLGGVFAETNWRWCFGVNIPICLVALIMMWMWLQINSGNNEWEHMCMADQIGRIDFLGIGLLTTSVVLILYALSSGGAAYPWSHPIIIATVTAGFLGIIAFALWERCRWCRHPIMAPHVFSNRTTVAAFIITVVHGFITYGFQFYLPPFFQAVLGASPTESGVLILPCTLTIVVMAAVGGPLLARFGQYRLMHGGGFVLMAVGFLLCMVFSKTSSITLWIAFSFLVGIGSGTIVSTTLPTVLVELTDKENAAATGSWAFLRGLGSLLGVAVPNAAFNAQFSTVLPLITSSAARAQLSGGQAYQHASAAFVVEFGPKAKEQIVAAFSSSFRVSWVMFLVLAVFGIFVAMMERQVKLRKDLDSDFGLKQREKSECVEP